MREIEKWIWLPRKRYPAYQTTVFHPFVAEKEDEQSYTVADFRRTYRFEKKVTSARLRFSADTTFRLWLNGELLSSGPVSIGGDFAFNEQCRNQHYATELTVSPDEETLQFYAQVQMMPLRFNEYSKGRGGFMLTAHLEFADGTFAVIMTDRTWECRRDGRYVRPFVYDATILPDAFIPAEEIQNIWYPETVSLPERERTMIVPNGGGRFGVPAGEEVALSFEYDRVYAAFMTFSVKTLGVLKITAECFELEASVGKEELVFKQDADYMGFAMHSIGGYRIVVKNDSDSDAEVTVGACAVSYPAPECALTVTSDEKMNRVLELCRHALKYCRQMMHLDSPLHSEPLACTGDYYIETLMTAFSFGDMRLAETDVRRTAELLRYNDGRMFHTTYSCIWVLMAYDTYMFTGHKELLCDCTDALYLLLQRFHGYLGENGLIEHPTDYMFVDWLTVDDIPIHHPSKNLGQSVLSMFYYGALYYGAKIYTVLDMHAMAEQCRKRAEKLKEAINSLLYDPEKGLYTEGLPTLTEEAELNDWLPQSNGKTYYRKHANILAAYFGICDTEQAGRILRQVVADPSLGECQPYFLHFLLEAVYRNQLTEELTMPILEEWKHSADRCGKGLQEGFYAPGGYTFDLSHGWGGTPLYALPKALLGFEMIKPGFEEIRLSPSLLGLEHATVEILTPYGMICCEQRKGQDVRLTVPEKIRIQH